MQLILWCEEDENNQVFTYWTVNTVVFTLTNQSSWGGQGLSDLAWKMKISGLCACKERRKGEYKDINYLLHPRCQKLCEECAVWVSGPQISTQTWSVIDGWCQEGEKFVLYAESRRAWSRSWLLRRFNRSLKGTEKLWPSIDIIEATWQGRGCHQAEPFLFFQHLENGPEFSWFQTFWAWSLSAPSANLHVAPRSSNAAVPLLCWHLGHPFHGALKPSHSFPSSAARVVCALRSLT